MSIKHLKGLCRSRARGAALLLVLWITALLAVILGGFAVLARTELMQSRNLFDTIRARLAAEAGLARAVYELNRGDQMTKWIADGRSYEIEFEGIGIEIVVQDESGKVDINAADAATLQAMFVLAGAEDDVARKLAAAVIDWRDPDDLAQPEGAEDADYEAADLPYGAADYPFRLAPELQQVLGMDYELYRKVAEWITVYGGNGRPNAAFAPAALLPLFPGITPEIAQQLVAQRHAMDAAQMQATPLTMADGQQLIAVGGSGNYTVRSSATLPNGTEAAIEVTLRMGGGPGGRAYSVLRWREPQTGL
ncbi:MAG: type II secretion system minor pseudopilin GspK [Lysobacterales bacterium]